MVREPTLRQVGGSIGATIPKDMAERLHLEAGDRVLAKAHPFNDGHKRTAFLAAVILLGLNGKDLDATEAEVVQMITALAAGSLTEVALAKWIRERLAQPIRTRGHRQQASLASAHSYSKCTAVPAP